MPAIQRSKPALQSFRWPSTRAVVGRTDIISYNESPQILTAETLPQYNSDIDASSNTTIYDTLSLFLQSTQKVAARLLADPGFTRARVFRFTAPIALFVSLLTMIKVLPPHEWFFVDPPAQANNATAVRIAKVGFLCLLLVCGTLSSLWMLILLFALSVKRFIEADLDSGRRPAGIFNNLLGGLFTD